MLQQREVVGNVEDDTDEELLKHVDNAAAEGGVGNVEDDTDKELLKHVANAIYAVLDEFNAAGSD